MSEPQPPQEPEASRRTEGPAKPRSPSEARAPDRPEMLDDPGLSRQWVLRRLQKTLTADRALVAFLEGLAASAGRDQRRLLEPIAHQVADRARLIRSRILAEGGQPYSSIGLARRFSRLGGRVLGTLGPWSWRMPVRWSLEYSYAELDNLAALARGARGVDPATGEILAPEVEKAREALERVSARP